MAPSELGENSKIITHLQKQIQNFAESAAGRSLLITDQSVTRHPGLYSMCRFRKVMAKIFVRTGGNSQTEQVLSTTRKGVWVMLTEVQNSTRRNLTREMANPQRKSKNRLSGEYFFLEGLFLGVRIWNYILGQLSFQGANVDVCETSLLAVFVKSCKW